MKRFFFFAWLACGTVAVLTGRTTLAQQPAYELADEIQLASHCDACDNGGCDGGCDTGCDTGCDSGCDSGCDCSCYLFGPDEPWTLFGEHCSGITAGGWVQAGYHTYDTGMFNNYPDVVQLHQAWGFLEKEADGSCGWDWGFRMDYVYGTDGPDTQAFNNPNNGWDIDWDNGNFYGHAIPQLYASVAVGDLNVKVGHFFTIIGYEVVPATGNFFYSHAFTMYNSEPFTHTGALAEYALDDDITLWGGWTAGWDTGFEDNGDIFLGGISAALTDNVTGIYAITAGSRSVGDTGYSHSLIFDVTLTDNLNYVFQNDYLSYRTFKTVGVNQYLFHTLNDCLAHGIRFEWYQINELGDATSDLYEFTYGFNYRPHANVVLRPEIRWDKDNDGFIIPASDNDQLGFGMDAIFTF